MKKANTLVSFWIIISAIGVYAFGGNPYFLPNPYQDESIVVQDTIPPITPREGDFLTDPQSNPFDLKDPKSVEQSVEYDPETGQYIITERIGEEYYRMPSYMTFDEYLEYRTKKEEKAYFDRLSGNTSGDHGEFGFIDPIKKVDIQDDLVDRLFGGTDVSIQPDGSIDITFGANYQHLENPLVLETNRRRTLFDFDMDIQMNLQGKIGDKLNLNTSYNTKAVFNFENQMKLNYDSHEFGEDEIIKKIEAGNVSLPLRSNLIQGSQSLFGLKTELQFGHLWLTAIASQQKSKRKEIIIKGGKQTQLFEIFADEYDENRHFFLSHYNKNTFEESLKNLPQVKSLFKINKVQVWITNDRNSVQGTRDIVALADLGEHDNLTSPNVVTNPAADKDYFGTYFIPDNQSNNLYKKLTQNKDTRIVNEVVNTLNTSFNLKQGSDYEKIRARPLSSSEFTYNSDLGFISVSANVRPDQVLAVAYEYTYNGKVHQVGEISTDIPQVSQRADSAQNVIFVKMLKSSSPRVDLPLWKLMMKNVYSIGAFQVAREDFKLDVFYDDPGEGTKRSLPESDIKGTPLLRVMSMDRLNINGDPHPDGIFDFVPGITINTRNGRIMFPVLEPFGKTMKEAINNPSLEKKYVYQQLYDSTLTRAREFPELNRYIIKGRYNNSSISSEISLGTFNLPEGSVRVNAGGQSLKEGEQFTLDYKSGRLKILDEAILNAGGEIKITFEDNATFGFQTKTMLGLRADYRFSEDFSIGATFMKLFEKPYTQKVNIGNDPINNNIFGLDLSVNKKAPWLTKLVDKIPLINTKEESSISFLAEGAVLRPGHARAINVGNDENGSVYLDDFEGSASGLDLANPPTSWVLSSIPQDDDRGSNPLFPESKLVNDIYAGVNRANLNWYRIENSNNCSLEPGDDPLKTSYCEQISFREVFPNRQIPPGQLNVIYGINMSFDPLERGPYNFEKPAGTEYSDGIATNGRLVNPESRWGGIMRSIQTNDFEQSNYEYIEFWMMSPFIQEGYPGGNVPNHGDFYINLGNVSEDILRDSRQFLENGLPSGKDKRPVDRTNWGKVPRVAPLINAFANDEEARSKQDVGLDGLTDAEELTEFDEVVKAYESHITNSNWLNAFKNDPSNDNFKYYTDYEEAVVKQNPLVVYDKFNNPQGNSQQSGGTTLRASTNLPDGEDLNRDNNLNELESYFQYKIHMERDGDEMIPTEYVTDARKDEASGRTWYRFKIPLDQYTSKVGGIADFRSVRFIRLYMNGWDKRVNLRFANFELVRNQWRRYQRNLQVHGPKEPQDNDPLFDVNGINIEEHANRLPFNYTVPPGVEREASLGAYPNIQQNEQSLSINVCDLGDGDARAIYKNIRLDLRLYERMKMFIHAESQENIDSNDMKIFVRIGSDFERNYYEYEVPMVLSDVNKLPPNVQDPEYKKEVWSKINFDFPLKFLKDIKVERNSAGQSSSEIFELEDPENRGAIARVVGNPNLGAVRGVMIGIRNTQNTVDTPNDGQSHCAEIWVNELRVSGLDEKGGHAALARIDMTLADFGSISASGNYSSIGWGSIEEKLENRQREQISSFDVSASAELGKFLYPEVTGIKVPFYAQLSNTYKDPQYDPYDLDIPLQEKLARAAGDDKKQIQEQARDFTSVKSLNFSNVRKDRMKKDRKPMPWDVENLSATYTYTETLKRDPIIEEDKARDYTGALNYSYSAKPYSIQPFKKIKNDKFLKWLKEFNFNPIPSSYGVKNQLNRHITSTRYRFTGGDGDDNTFYSKSFTWDRNYNLNWKLAKSLDFSYSAMNRSIVDELDNFDYVTMEPITREVQDAFVKENLKNLGRTKDFTQNVTASYKVPLKYFPGLDFINLTTKASAGYSWNAATMGLDSLGNIIQNNQNRSVNGDFDFTKLYKKSKYLKKIESGNKKKKKKKNSRFVKPDKETDKKDDKKNKKKKKKKERQVTTAERLVIRPLLLVRKAKFSYSEDFRSVIPGFLPKPKYFGLQDGFAAPGWDFVSGFQPNSQWLDKAGENGWISDNVFMNQEVLQSYTQKFSGGLTLEPIKRLKIDINVDKSYSKNHSEFFKVPDSTGFQHLTPKDVGAFSISYLALNTMFKDSEEELDTLFATFERNRKVISNRIAPEGTPIVDSTGYREGYGRNQIEVIVPAFLSAYTGDDINTTPTGWDKLFASLPRPNWNLTYSGLSKLDWFKDHLASFSLKHGYKSTMTISSFATDLNYNASNPFEARNETTNDFYSEYEVPAILISERFSPLLGIDMKLKNDMSFRLDLKKSRELALNATNSQLAESKSTEYTFSFGYRMKDVVIGFLQFDLTGKTPKRKKKSKIKIGGADDNSDDPKGKEQKGSDLNFKFDFSYKDDITTNRVLDQGTADPTRGALTLRISPSVDYDVNKNLNMKLFFDYSRTIPKTLQSFPITNAKGGVRITFRLN